MVLPSGLAVQRLCVGLSAPDLEDRLRILLRDRFGEPATAEAVLRELLRIEPAELAPGALLLHAHIPQVDRSEVNVAAGAEGVPVEGVDEPARVLFVLLSGTDQPAAEHLRALAGVAGIARIEGIVERLAGATDPEQARRALIPSEDVEA